MTDVEPASDAFGLVSDSTRLEILRTLVEKSNERMGFAQLRRACGVTDSGRFNYHLDKLEGPFVRHDENGYRATWPAIRLTTLVFAGTVQSDEPSVSDTVRSVCPDCDQQSIVNYDEGVVRVSCPTHDWTVQWPFPPNAVKNRSPSALLEAVASDVRSHMERIRTGVCPFCRSQVEATIDPDPPDALEPMPDDTYVAVNCDTCWLEGLHPMRVLLCGCPSVVTFARQVGENPTLVSFLPHSPLDVRTTVADESGHVDVELHHEAGTARLELDESFAVRSPATGITEDA